MLRSMRGRILAPGILLATLGGCSRTPPCAPVHIERRHPFLAFDQREIPELRQRVKRAPYQTWMDAVRQGLPQQGLPCGPFTTSDPDNQELQASSCALYGALSWVVDQNKDALNDARQALLNAGKYSTGWSSTPGAWYWGGALLNYAYAYDFVQPALSESNDKAIRDKLEDALDKTMGAFDRCGSAYTTNFRYRVGGGAATLSYALGERCHACTVERDLFGDAPLRTLCALYSYGPYMQACVTADGTYTEGPSYQDDVSSVVLPYLLAMKRLSGGDRRGRDYINALNTPPAWGNDTRLARMLRYGAALSMPDGNAATLETGWRQPLQLVSIAASALRPDQGRRDVQGLYSWLGAKGKALVNNPVYNILYTDREIAETRAGTVEPTYTSLVTSDMTSLRSGWGADAIHLLMTSEHEYRPSSHSQPDQTSFLLHAKGQYLLIDPGDGRNYDPPSSPHTSPYYWVNFSPEPHNLVTIDSYKGIIDTYQTPAWHQHQPWSNLTRPIDDPAILQASFLTGELDASTVTISGYVNVPDVSTRRTAALARKSYVVVFDHMTSTVLHYYDAHLHYSGWLGCRPDANPVCTDYATATPSAPASTVDCGDVCGMLLPAADPAAGRLLWATKSDDGKRDIELEAVYVPRPTALSVDHGGFTNFFPNMTFRHPFSVARYLNRTSAQAPYLSPTTQWLAVLYPRDVTAGETKPAIDALPVSGGNGSAAALVSLPAQGTQDLAVVSDGAQPAEVSDPRLPATRLQGKSALLLLRGQALERANLDAATLLSLGGRALFLAAAPVAASLRPEGAAIAAELVLSAPTQVSLAVPAEGTQLLLDGKPAPTTYDPATRTASTTVPQGRHRLAAAR